jgi:hypothetical protein
MSDRWQLSRYDVTHPNFIKTVVKTPAFTVVFRLGSYSRLNIGLSARYGTANEHGVVGEVAHHNKSVTQPSRHSRYQMAGWLAGWLAVKWKRSIYLFRHPYSSVCYDTEHKYRGAVLSCH